MRNSVGLSLLALAAACGASSETPAPPGRDYERIIERMPDGFDARDHHTATPLADGTVLVVGGAGLTGVVARADRFHPGERAFRDGGSLLTPRMAHAAQLLSGGEVLVTGGWDPLAPGTGFDEVLRSTELYDPAASRFTAGPDMRFPRRHHTMTPLADGRVLVAGGIQLRGTGFGASPNTEVYEPVANAFVEGPRMVAASGRWLHSATRLADGRVLLAGGRDNNCGNGCAWSSLASAEIYDPATNAFTATGSLGIARHGHGAALLPDGRVLILGGETTVDLGSGSDQVTTAEVWDPATGRFTPHGATRDGRSLHALARLDDGTFLVVGGRNQNGSPTGTTEIFDAARGTSIAGPEMNDWRIRATATRLPGGEVLIVGGHNSGQPVVAVDLFR